MDVNLMNELVDRYIASWNETDAARRRALIEQTWTERARYLDPLTSGDGHAGIDTMVQAVQQRFAGHRFERSGTVDGHHDRLRFGWDLVAGDAPSTVVASGVDFGVIVDGRLEQVTGFLQPVPA